MTEPTKISFAIQSFDITEHPDDPKFAYAKIQAFSSHENRHGMFCSEDILKMTAPTIYETPIIYNWDKSYGSYKNSFGTHTDAEKSMIAGFVIPNSATFERLPDSRLSLTVDAKLWKTYVPQVLDVLKENDGFSHVSVEMNLLDSSKRDDGLYEMKNFEYLGVCLLGNRVVEASPGANIQILSFAEAKSEFELSLKEDFSKSIDLSIPKNVKDNVQKGLELHKKYGRGGSSVSLASARHISSNDVSNPEKVKYLYKVHKSNNFKDMTKNPPSDSYIRFLLHGGQEGKDWSTKLCEQLDASDNVQNAYFGENKMAEIINDDEDDTNKTDADTIDTGKEKPYMDVKEEEKKEEMAVETPKEEMAVEEKEKEETPEEEAKETKEEEKEEEKEEKKMSLEMSLESYLDVKAMLAFLQSETEDYKQIAAEFAKPKEEADFCKVMAFCWGKMCKMAEEFKTCSDENMSLKEFKASIEKQEYTFAVNSTIKDIENTVEIPKDEIEKLVLESQKYTLQTVDAWKNYAKATAFNFAKKDKAPEETEHRIGLFWQNTTKPQTGTVWDRLK